MSLAITLPAVETSSGGCWHESGLVPRLMTYEDDLRLPEFGIGLTSIVARASRGSSELDRVEFEKGRRLLAEKVMRYRPKAIGFLGVTVF